MHFKEGEAKDLQMNCHKDVATTDSEALQIALRGEVKVIQSHHGYQQEILNIIQKFESMWGGPVGQVGIAKYRFYLTLPGSQLNILVTYRTRPKVWQLEKTKINKTFQMNVMGPAQS